MYSALKLLHDSDCPRWGFVGVTWELKEEATSMGVGDDAPSWGLDVRRGKLWLCGSSDARFGGTAVAGDILGFAANVDAGKIAVSKNGNWEEAPFGVVVEDEAIKQGVIPAFTAQLAILRYAIKPEEWTHNPPPTGLWENRGCRPRPF